MKACKGKDSHLQYPFLITAPGVLFPTTTAMHGFGVASDRLHCDMMDEGANRIGRSVRGRAEVIRGYGLDDEVHGKEYGVGSEVYRYEVWFVPKLRSCLFTPCLAPRLISSLCHLCSGIASSCSCIAFYRRCLGNKF